jgi:hypothetical protein
MEIGLQRKTGNSGFLNDGVNDTPYCECHDFRHLACRDDAHSFTLKGKDNYLTNVISDDAVDRR